QTRTGSCPVTRASAAQRSRSRFEPGKMTTTTLIEGPYGDTGQIFPARTSVKARAPIWAAAQKTPTELPAALLLNTREIQEDTRDSPRNPTAFANPAAA